MRNFLGKTYEPNEQTSQRAGSARSLWWLMGMIGISLFPQIASSLQTTRADSPELRVAVTAGKLSVDARDVSRDKILNSITEKTGIQFHAMIPLDEKTSVSFSGLAAEAALREILGAETNLFLRYPDQANASTPGALPAEAWILGRGQEVAPGKLPGGQTRKPSTAAASKEEDLFPEDVKPLNPDQIKDQLDKLRTGDAEERARAILRLGEDGKAGEEEIRKAMETATNDSDPQVRALAIQTLASQGQPEAAAEYLRQGLHDPDASVRLMALASLSPGTEDGHLVREAMQDPDAAVRTQAAELMKVLGLSTTSDQ